MRTKIRKLTIAGVLGAVAILLGATPLGFIPVPTPAGSATIMHIPVIIGAIMEGPVVGAAVGLIFGLFSFIRGGAFFVDPLVAILPRVLIGILAAYSYMLINRKTLGSIVAAIVGTLTNTIGVLGMATMQGYLNKKAAIGVGLTHGLPEVVVGVLITVSIVKVLERTELSREY